MDITSFETSLRADGYEEIGADGVQYVVGRRRHAAS